MFFFASRSEGSASVITTEIPDLVDCSLKLGWDIRKDRHAALVMIDANHHEIAFEGRLYKFIQNQKYLADNVFVTKVYRCSAYAQLITERGKHGRAVVSSAGNDLAWRSFSQTGHWVTGMYHPSLPYTPLATLRQIKPRQPSTGYRNLFSPAIEGTEDMENYVPPWDELDEEGEEVVYDDEDESFEGW